VTSIPTSIQGGEKGEVKSEILSLKISPISSQIGICKISNLQKENILGTIDALALAI